MGTTNEAMNNVACRDYRIPQIGKSALLVAVYRTG